MNVILRQNARRTNQFHSSDSKSDMPASWFGQCPQSAMMHWELILLWNPSASGRPNSVATRSVLHWGKPSGGGGCSGADCLADGGLSVGWVGLGG